MLGSVFFVFSLAHLGLLIWSLRQPGAGFPVGFLRCLLLALAFDNLVIALGPLMIELPLYQLMSALRFWVHAILLPLLLVFIAHVLKEHVSGERLRTWLPRLGWALAGIAIGYGYVTDLAVLDLVAADYYPRLVAADAQLPLATIAVNIVVVVAGIWLWRVAQWPWLFLGALQIFLLNGFSAGREWGFVVGNSAELLFVFSLWVTLNAVGKPGDIERPESLTVV